MCAAGSAAAMVSGMAAGSAQAQAQAQTQAPLTPPQVARAFGAREAIQQISLSPDGAKVAIVAPRGARGTQVLIADPIQGGEPKSILTASGAPENVTKCAWTSASRLVCELFFHTDLQGVRVGVTRLVGVDAAGGKVKLVSADRTARSLGVTQYGGALIDMTGGGDGAVLMTRDYVPENTIGTRLASSAEGLGVERVDTVSLKRTPIEPARRGAVEYITDGVGTVRIMGLMAPAPGGQISNRIDYNYRKPGERGWTSFGTLMIGDGRPVGFNPVAVDPKLEMVYGFDERDGRRALFRTSLDGSLKRELVLASPRVDVDRLVTIGRQKRVVGVSYATEVRQVEYFDPELKRLRDSLERALPGHPAVGITDASADERTLLLHAGSDVDPGRYYLYTKADRRLTEVLPSRPEIAAVKLATMKPITYKAADGTVIPGYLTLPAGSDGKGLPAIVMPHGGPGARDEWGFDWWAQYFAARGYAVIQPNFRGSAGYGAEWFQQNGFRSWRTAVGDVNDAGRWLVAQGVADPKKLAIVGWSYGGYAALQSSVLDPGLFKAVIAVAPVTDLDLLRDESAQYTNHAQVVRFVGNGPHIREGSPARNAAAIKAPVLLFHGDLDQNVRVGESRLMEQRLRAAGGKVDYVEFKGLDHQLDDSAARAEMLEKSDAFLRGAMGM